MQEAVKKLDQFQLKRVKVLSEAIVTLTEVEKEYLWQRIRDSYVQKIGIDPALMTDFFPKAKENDFDLSNIEMPPGSPIGIVDVGRGILKPPEKPKPAGSGQPASDKSQNTQKTSEQGKKPEQGKPDQAKKQGDKAQDKQNPKKK